MLGPISRHRSVDLTKSRHVSADVHCSSNLHRLFYIQKGLKLALEESEICVGNALSVYDEFHQSVPDPGLSLRDVGDIGLPLSGKRAVALEKYLRQNSLNGEGCAPNSSTSWRAEAASVCHCSLHSDSDVVNSWFCEQVRFLGKSWNRYLSEITDNMSQYLHIADQPRCKFRYLLLEDDKE